ncbi:RING finger protein C14orf164-like protein [Dinothrombium tinctorium]|uniref:RING finger protein C14orf164-like protein n=1 Tax=Dinothrombium tinctorium TaxID=1965070 RepID=A0A3S3P3J8_9ACAR|nr:RING finger protein C14orf164-like protein [Dinothrombium tinctorium]
MQSFEHFVHCNECLSFPSNGTKIYFTTCGHLYCDRCVNSGVLNDSICKNCRQKCGHTLLSANLKPQTLQYFEDDVYFLQKYEKIRNFQKKQTELYLKHSRIEVLHSFLSV